MKTLFKIVVVLLYLQVNAQEEIIDIDVAQTKTDISFTDATILGVVEGFTEYLPISSTGHLIIANSLLQLNGDQPLLDNSNNPIVDENGTAYTMSDAANAYAIVIQFGAILAVAMMYWQWILKMMLGLLGRNPEGLKLLINLIIAFLPAAVIGLIFNDLIESYLFGIEPIIIALFGGALLMFGVEKYYKKRKQSNAIFVKMKDLSAKKSLMIGFLQCIAMWPGTSRSMMTILGGYLAGMKPEDSARFSFLLGLMTLSAASFYKTYKDGEAMLATLSFTPLVVGLIVAFFSALISVKWLIGFLTRNGLVPFAWYRIMLATLLSILLYYNLIS